jgi:hypothetical protein
MIHGSTNFKHLKNFFGVMKRFCFPAVLASDILSESQFHGVSLRYLFAVVKSLYLSSHTRGSNSHVTAMYSASEEILLSELEILLNIKLIC